MKYFDLHADTAYRCLGENLAFNDNALHITADKASVFDEWHQCFVAFIKDGIKAPFEYYKKAVAFFVTVIICVIAVNSQNRKFAYKLYALS